MGGWQVGHRRDRIDLDAAPTVSVESLCDDVSESCREPMYAWLSRLRAGADRGVRQIGRLDDWRRAGAARGDLIGWFDFSIGLAIRG